MALFFFRVVIGRMNSQNCEAISVLSYFFSFQYHKKNKHIPPTSNYQSTLCIFIPDHRMKNWCSFSALEMTTNTSISEFLTETNFQVFSNTHSLKSEDIYAGTRRKHPISKFNASRETLLKCAGKQLPLLSQCV